MKVSYNWLNEFVNLKEYTPQKVAETLTMHTCEVEDVYQPYQFLKDLIVAEVTHIEKHPNADKLQVLKVNTSENTIQIITGAKNVALHKKYPLAQEGTLLPKGITIRKSKLRGLESEGMLCSSKETALESFQLFETIEDNATEDGIWTLPDSFTTGNSLLRELQLNDTILEIDNKSITHRPDLWGHLGIARELSSLLNIPMLLQPENIKALSPKTKLNKKFDSMQIYIKNEVALYYSSTIFTDLKVRTSPYSIQSKLILLGMRPKNNIVDASNITLLGYGQPNHTFDFNTIDPNITIDFAQNKQRFEALNDNLYTLESSIPVVLNSPNKVLALAGIIGGKSTQVSQTTQTILLESAIFHRSHIRKASSVLKLKTDSSQRFEKGLDPHNAKQAIQYFASILQQSNPSLSMGETKEILTEPILQNKIKTSYSFIQQKLGKLFGGKEDITGKDITKKEIKAMKNLKRMFSHKIPKENITDITKGKIKTILERLNMEVTEEGDTLNITVPSFRSYYDITIEEDIVEEVGRYIEYNTIIPEAKQVICQITVTPRQELETNLRQLLSNRHNYQEVYNYAFHSQEDINLDTYYNKPQSAVKLMNPIHQEMPFMRISPLPSLLNNIQNQYKKHHSISFYELEDIFCKDKYGNADTGTGVAELSFVAGIQLDQNLPTKSTHHFYALSSMIKDIVEYIGISPEDYSVQRGKGRTNIFHPARYATLITTSTTFSSYFTPTEKEKQSTTIFHFGQLHPKLCDTYKLPHNILYFEALLADLIQGYVKKDFIPLEKFPSATFEFTIVVPKFEDYGQTIQSLDLTLQKTKVDSSEKDQTYLHQVDLMAIYQDDVKDKEYKYLSLKVTWVNHTRTIEKNELQQKRDNLIKKINEKNYKLKE